MTVKFIDTKKEQWEDYLDTCIYAYNTSKHESSKYTPFEVMFGRRAVLPVDISRKPLDEQPEMKEFDDNFIDLEMEERREWLEIVKENILNAQKKQKEEYDIKHSKPEVSLIGALACLEKRLHSKKICWRQVRQQMARSLQDNPFIG